jgi:hypothetical protein
MNTRRGDVKSLQKVFCVKKRTAHFQKFCEDHDIKLYYLEKGNVNSQPFELVKGNFRCFGKKVPMIPEDFEFLNNENQISFKLLFKDEQYLIWREIFIMILVNKLMNKNISPHFPYFFNYHFSFDNENRDKTERPHIYLCQEKFDCDLKTWSQNHPSKDDWFSCFFQIFFALYALQKYIGIVHNDLHWGNILVKKLSKPSEWTYKLQSNRFLSLSDQRYLFVVCDFGCARFDPTIVQHSENSLKDYRRLVQNVFRWMNKTPDEPLLYFIRRIRDPSLKNMTDVLNTVVQPYFKNQISHFSTIYDLSENTIDFFQ